MKCAKNANSAIVFAGALRPLNIATNTHDGLGVLDGFEIGWGPKTSAVSITPCPPTGRVPKKTPPPSPCGRPVTAPRGTPQTDPMTIYQSVGRTEAAVHLAKSTPP